MIYFVRERRDFCVISIVRERERISGSCFFKLQMQARLDVNAQNGRERDTVFEVCLGVL